MDKATTTTETVTDVKVGNTLTTVSIACNVIGIVASVVAAYQYGKGLGQDLLKLKK